MTIRLSTLFALSAFCFAGPLLAEDEKAPSTEASARAGSEMVCRVDKSTGSRVWPERVCKTRDQWRLDQQEQRQAIELVQGRKAGTVR